MQCVSTVTDYAGLRASMQAVRQLNGPAQDQCVKKDQMKADCTGISYTTGNGTMWGTS